MTKRRTTTDVLRERRAEFDREQRASEASFDALTPLVEDLCNAGLVDDVDPDGPVRPTVEPVCMGCGRVADANWCGEPCPRCGGMRWQFPGGSP